MNASREKLLQLLVEKMRCVIKSMRKAPPFGDKTLGRPQVEILFFIARQKEDVSVKDLAKSFNVTPGAITQLVDDLVDKNLVKREEDKNDRRLLKIKLTKNAKEKFDEFRKNYFKSVKPLFDKLSDSEIAQLLKLLDKVNTSAL